MILCEVMVQVRPHALLLKRWSCVILLLTLTLVLLLVLLSLACITTEDITIGILLLVLHFP